VDDPPADAPAKDARAMEGHAVTTPRADRLAASPHPIQTVPGATSQRAMTVDRPAATSVILGHCAREIATHDHLALATAMVVRSAPAIAPIGETGRHGRSVPMAQGAPSAADVPTADPIAAVAPTRNGSGPRAVRPRAETVTPVSVNLKRIAIPLASARFVPSTRPRRSLRA